jgi:hypothetical protein
MANEYAVNQSDLVQVADSIRTKGETTNQLVFPSGFVDAIQMIRVGVAVQRNAGTFTTTTKGKATVNCGFRPDLVVIGKGEVVENAHFSTAFAFEENNREYEINSALYVSDVGEFYAYDIYAQSTENGFSVKIMEMNYEIEFDEANGAEFDYVAIKYTP